jgi:hypothetical protein
VWIGTETSADFRQSACAWFAIDASCLIRILTWNADLPWREGNRGFAAWIDFQGCCGGFLPGMNPRPTARGLIDTKGANCGGGLLRKQKRVLHSAEKRFVQDDTSLGSVECGVAGGLG